jgi:hypothetical protein
MSQNTEAISFPAVSAVQSFSGGGLSSCFHCMDCLFTSGVWWWIQDLSPVTSLAGNSSGSLFWRASSSWQFCTLLFFVWGWDLLKPRVHRPSSSLNLCGLLHELLHDRCCQLQFINSYMTDLHDVRETRHSWRCAGCFWVAWTDSLLDSFMLTVATFHPSKHSAMIWGSFSTYGFLVTPLSSKTTVWYTFVQDITFHYARQHTTDWHNHPAKMEPMPSSGTIYKVNG